MNRYGLDDTCDALPFLNDPGVCNRCGKALTGRQTQWCREECFAELAWEHSWDWARKAARDRDGNRCVRCGSDGSEQRPKRWAKVESINAARRLGLDWPATLGCPSGLFIVKPRNPWLEVNHIEPRMGRGYGFGCHNHLTNLETLCHRCHVAETNRQYAERRGDQLVDVLQLALFQPASPSRAPRSA
ncbi:hypothetical protein BKG82_13020 [Mycobacteroides chelonae]|uniref:HNH domain-containing protein n=1 Tax=Mycobacteroides chelonae TaxID=1774 RepID=A0A1S1LP74_MYCCH|nr:HNH endonuclease [Mycobacteroides chelonae]OHU57105.1 hypothetical protein BKG82_13020 [Mycobacteroides chelonae]